MTLKGKVFTKEQRVRINAVHRKWIERNNTPERKVKAAEYLKQWRKLNQDKDRAARNKESRKASKRISDRKWQQNNREKRKIIYRRWKTKHPDKPSEYFRKNKDARMAVIRAWKQKNLLRVRHLRRQYLARKSKAPGTHTYEQWISRVEYYGWRCAYCLVVLNTKTLTQDHVIPIVSGGSDWASNLVPACKPCNCKKNCKRKRPIHLDRPSLLCPLGPGDGSYQPVSSTSW